MDDPLSLRNEPVSLRGDSVAGRFRKEGAGLVSARRRKLLRGLRIFPRPEWLPRQRNCPGARPSNLTDRTNRSDKSNTPELPAPWRTHSSGEPRPDPSPLGHGTAVALEQYRDDRRKETGHAKVNAQLVDFCPAILDPLATPARSCLPPQAIGPAATDGFRRGGK